MGSLGVWLILLQASLQERFNLRSVKIFRYFNGTTSDCKAFCHRFTGSSLREPFMFTRLVLQQHHFPASYLWMDHGLPMLTDGFCEQILPTRGE